jgi:UDP-N-acetylmuramoyl-L-alanyl-D-glutamate--2,6-diaminopimelate ligase
MRLAVAIADLGDVTVVGDADVAISAVDYDSRRVVEGSLFCCLRGATRDGHDFADSAWRSGAAALLVDHELPVDAPQVVVADTRRAMALVSATFYGHPSAALRVIGVTGTNGKTTVTHLIANAFDAAGLSARVLGTLSGTRTTPESSDLQRTLAAWRDEGVQAVAMEVSSHALTLHRVEGTRFRVVVFTNLSRDHLDFHGSMESYFEAKASLFRPELADAAVVNLDSPHGRLLRDTATISTTGYSLDDLAEVRVGTNRSSFVWRGNAVEIGLGGLFNVSNALAAAEAARVAGVDVDAVVAGLGRPLVLPGRFEVVTAAPPFAVVVDYAHTPDALEQVLTSARALAVGGLVTVVFGCGGERDVTKRPLMGEVAARLADRVVLTADNSRGEDTGAIIDAVRQGYDRATPRHATELVIEPDRRAAIVRAIDTAREGDIVLIAGKGHESTITLGDRVLPFDDRQVAREALTERRNSEADR